MSSDIRSILERLAAVEEGRLTPVAVKKGLNPQQKSVDQLPALFKPKDISPTLTKKPYQKHPMDGKLVGETALNPKDPNADLIAKRKALQDLEREPGHDKEAIRQRKLDLDKEARQKGLAEAMQEVEEDMLGKVKRDFIDYIGRLEDKINDDGRREKSTPELDKLSKKEKIDRDLIDKARAAVERGEAEEDVNEDPTQAEPGPDFKPEPVIDPTLPESAPVQTVALENTVFEIHGDDEYGFEIRRGGRSLPTRFPNIDQANMALKMFKHRRAHQDRGQDYIEEK